MLLINIFICIISLIIMFINVLLSVLKKIKGYLKYENIYQVWFCPEIKRL